MADVMQILSSPMDIPNGRRPGGPELSGSEDEDVFPLGTPKSYRSNPSPRCEAFVMTGEKMLRLNSKISPSYAQALQEQLPPETPILQPTNHLDGDRKRGPFDDFPSWKHKVTKKRSSSTARDDLLSGVPNSQSEHVLGETPTGGPGQGPISRVVISESHEYFDNGEAGESCVTVNALCEEMSSGSKVQSGTLNSLPRNGCIGSTGTFNGSKSEPVSPAKYAFGVKEDTTTQQQNTLIISVGKEDPEGSGHLVSTLLSEDSPASSVSSTPLKEKLKKLDEGNGFVHASSVDRDSGAAARLAKRLYALDGFKKSDVAAHLAKNNDFGAQVALEYVKLFNFAGLRVDAALRKFLSRFCLVGESSERERVLTYFSKRYHDCNPGVFNNEDDVHTMACALLLLNTDLHGQNIGRKMSCHNFIDNLNQAGFDFSRDLLKTLYSSIKSTPLEWAKDSMSDSDATLSVITTHSQQFDQRFLEYPDPECQVEYKKGWVMRKCLVDSDGKKTPFGRRGWKMFYATLKGLVLYLHKDEHGFKKGSYQTFRNAVRVYHAWATKPQGYKKRQHVFRLRTATLGEFLFQTSDPQEVQAWVDSINFVAAAFSAPPLPAPVSSSRAFHKPLLPSAPSRLSLEEQIVEHEKQIASLEEQLNVLKEEAPPLMAKGRPVQEFFFKERYLEEERTRYLTYVHLLKSKLEDRVEVPGHTGVSSTISEASEEYVAVPTETETEAAFDAIGGQSGQSDRLSYRAAINSNWGASDENSFETIC